MYYVPASRVEESGRTEDAGNPVRCSYLRRDVRLSVWGKNLQDPPPLTNRDGVAGSADGEVGVHGPSCE